MLQFIYVHLITYLISWSDNTDELGVEELRGLSIELQ